MHGSFNDRAATGKVKLQHSPEDAPLHHKLDCHSAKGSIH
jgi:hypothetical protein